MKAGKRDAAELKSKKVRLQYAALPYRVADAVEVLLVTSRDTQRWVLPKGWPMKHRAPAKAAAREALEEAGVVGTVEKAPIGAYVYDKRLAAGATVRCLVDVFPLRVTAERSKWREKGQRERRWFAVDEAAGLVDEPDLQVLLRGFAPPTPARNAA